MINFETDSLNQYRNLIYCGEFLTLDPFICMFDPIYQPLRSGRIWHKVNFFQAEFNRFEFRVFLLLD